jgi:hypothetical protein
VIASIMHTDFARHKACFDLGTWRQVDIPGLARRLVQFGFGLGGSDGRSPVAARLRHDAEFYGSTN